MSAPLPPRAPDRGGALVPPAASIVRTDRAMSEPGAQPGEGAVVLPRRLRLALDALELWVPALAFLVLFAVFNAQIVARYVLRSPLSWSTEVCQLAFVWTAILGACYMRRTRGHIAFDMAFEAFSPRGKLWAVVMGNAIIGIACLGSLAPTIDYMAFLSGEETPILDIPMDWAFAPLPVFLVLIAAYSVLDVLAAARALARAR